MMPLRFPRSFAPVTSLTVSTVAALVLLAPIAVSPARAQTSAQAAPTAAPPDSNVAAPQASVTTGDAPDDQSRHPEQKGLPGQAIDQVKQVAKSASHIFRRVP